MYIVYEHQITKIQKSHLSTLFLYSTWSVLHQLCPHAFLWQCGPAPLCKNKENTKDGCAIWLQRFDSHTAFYLSVCLWEQQTWDMIVSCLRNAAPTSGQQEECFPRWCSERWPSDSGRHPCWRSSTKLLERFPEALHVCKTSFQRGEAIFCMHLQSAEWQFEQEMSEKNWERAASSVPESKTTWHRLTFSPLKGSWWVVFLA